MCACSVTWPCPILCDSIDCSLPASSVHGISLGRILEWVAISFSRGSSWPRDQTQVSHIVGRCFTVWATKEVLTTIKGLANHIRFMPKSFRIYCICCLSLKHKKCLNETSPSNSNRKSTVWLWSEPQILTCLILFSWLCCLPSAGRDPIGATPNPVLSLPVF